MTKLWMIDTNATPSQVIDELGGINAGTPGGYWETEIGPRADYAEIAELATRLKQAGYRAEISAVKARV